MGKLSKRLLEELQSFDTYDKDDQTRQDTVTSKVKEPKQNKQEKRAKKDSLSDSPSDLLSPITDKPVNCKCNKCGKPVSGKMLSVIYHPLNDVYFPFIAYECKHCQHSGRRSVYSLALPLAKFERTYF